MSKSTFENYNKRYFSRFGEIYVYDKLSFIKDAEKLTYPRPKVKIPVVRSTTVGALNSELTFRYEQVDLDLTGDVFNYDKDLGKISFNDALNEISIRGMFPDTMVAILIDDSFYIYNRPKLHCYGNHGIVVNHNCEPVYKINAESSGLFVKRFKATKLAKKIYPDAEEKDGWIYIW